jgi:hydrogenase maturation protease
MSDRPEVWGELERPGPESAVVAGTTIRRGSRVRLQPRAGGDIFDLALSGRLAEVVSLEEDDEGRLHVTVMLDDDPGRDLGAASVLGHRFFFGLDEVEPVAGGGQVAAERGPRILVAGIGNIFLGDDGFGVEVANRLSGDRVPDHVSVADFGIRGVHLAYELLDGYETVVLVDALPRGEAPGTVCVLEPDRSQLSAAPMDAHSMDPAAVLATLEELGGSVDRLLVVGCEPASVEEGIGLSEPVAAAVDDAVRVVLDLVSEASVFAGDKGG